MRTWKQNGETVGCDPEQLGTAASASMLACVSWEKVVHSRDAVLLDPAQRCDKR